MSTTLPDPPAAHDEHGEYHPDFVPVEEKKVSFWRKLGGGSLTVSILVHAAILAVGVIWVVAVIPPPPEKKVDFNPGGGGGGSPAAQANQTKQKKMVRNTASRVTAIGGASDLSLPEPDLSNTGMTSLGDLGSMAGGLGGSGSGGGRGTGSGLGIGGGIGDGMGIGSGLGSFMGALDANANALVGSFYDLKQNPQRQPSGVEGAWDSAGVVRDFVNSDWSSRHLDKYYKASVVLYQTRLLIPSTPAEAAVEAFQCADEATAPGWVVIYRGTVTPPETGTYRFVGSGDDMLAVRFNNEVVLDWGWVLTTGEASAYDKTVRDFLTDADAKNQDLEKRLREFPTERPVAVYPYSTTTNTNGGPGGLGAGKSFQATAGTSYPIEILISENQGGLFCASLLIEKVGEADRYPKDTTGSPIFPFFSTDGDVPLDPPQNNNIPPINGTAAPWKVVRPGGGRQQI